PPLIADEGFAHASSLWPVLLGALRSRSTASCSLKSAPFCYCLSCSSSCVGATGRAPTDRSCPDDDKVSGKTVTWRALCYIHGGIMRCVMRGLIALERRMTRKSRATDSD